MSTVTKNPTSNGSNKSYGLQKKMQTKLDISAILFR